MAIPCEFGAENIVDPIEIIGTIYPHELPETIYPKEQKFNPEPYRYDGFHYEWVEDQPENLIVGPDAR